MCQGDCKNLYVASITLVMCFAFLIFVLSSIQLGNKTDYGYKDEIAELKERKNYYYQGKLQNYDSLISDLKFHKRLAMAKTLVNWFYNLFVIIYGISRFKKLDAGCKLGIYFSLFLMIGYVAEFLLTFFSYKFSIKNTSKKDFWIIQIDIAIICFISFSLVFIIIILVYFFINDCGTSNFVDEENLWICTFCSDIMEKCCNLCNCCNGHCSNNCKKCSNSCEDCCDSFCQCLGSCCGGLCDNLYNCIFKCNCCCFNISCDESCSACSKCCDNYCSECVKFLKVFCSNIGKSCIYLGECCKICSGNDSPDLYRENNQLKSEKENLEIKLRNLKREKSRDLISDTNIINYSDEISNLKKNNDILIEKVKIMKKKNETITNELEIKKGKILKRNKEIYDTNQINAICYYLKNEKKFFPEDNDKYDIKNIYLEEISVKFGLNIDSDKFKEITLYYIKQKLKEHLTDSKTSEIFLKPVITKDGKTYEEKYVNKSYDYRQNKLVLELCTILKQSEIELKFDNYEKIRNLLKSKETERFFKNPMVISSGETIEVNEDAYEILEYKNLIIINIIEDIRELLEDKFLKL